MGALYRLCRLLFITYLLQTEWLLSYRGLARQTSSWRDSHRALLDEAVEVCGRASALSREIATFRSRSLWLACAVRIGPIYCPASHDSAVSETGWASAL